MPPNACPLCLNDDAAAGPAGHDRTGFDCERCGEFSVTGTLLVVLRAGQYKADLYKVSGMTRAASDRGQPLAIGTNTIEDLIKSAPIPQTPFDAIDRLLLVIHSHMPNLTGGVRLNDSDWPLVFARNFEEFRDFVNLTANVGYISLQRPPGAYWACNITLSGWSHIAELRRVGRTSHQAFVAMWFDQSVDEAWSEGFEPALTSAGYAPVRVDRVQHNGKIDDRIIAEIRRSGLLIADFTGDRGGVYYEAGLAAGLGLPVIYTVRRDYVDRLHFDTRQYNHIVWEAPGDLRVGLQNRIVATLGQGPLRASTASA